MTSVILPNSQIIWQNKSNGFQLAAAGFSPVVLDLEILGGHRAGQDIFWAKFFLNGNLITEESCHRYGVNHADAIGDRLIVVIPTSMLLPYPWAVNYILTVEAANPSDYFFIGPMVFHSA